MSDTKINGSLSALIMCSPAYSRHVIRMVMMSDWAFKQHVRRHNAEAQKVNRVLRVYGNDVERTLNMVKRFRVHLSKATN